MWGNLLTPIFSNTSRWRNLLEPTSFSFASEAVLRLSTQEEANCTYPDPLLDRASVGCLQSKKLLLLLMTGLFLAANTVHA